MARKGCFAIDDDYDQEVPQRTYNNFFLSNASLCIVVWQQIHIKN
jgi:hypothetical protein